MRRTALSLGLSALVTGAVLGLAPAANAWDGNAGQMNMWEHDAYQGQQESRSSYDSDLHNDACSGCDIGPGGNFGDDMSSFVNKTDYWWYFYTDVNYDGTKFCVRPRSHDGDLGNNGYSNLEDEISSIKKSSVSGSYDSSAPSGCDRIIGAQN